jgi:hypothetical protein
MKIFLVIVVAILFFSSSVFCQCPQGGVKIESEACEGPRNLAVASIICSEMRVKWMGNDQETYVVSAICSDPITNDVVEVTTSKYSSDKNGNFESIISVKEGNNVRWSVQGICLIENARIYSSAVDGEATFIPVCVKTRQELSNRKIKVFPNPTSDMAVVEYNPTVEGIIEIKVYDVTGKKILNKVANAIVDTNNQYKLDLKGLSGGTYMVEVENGKNISRTKIVLMKK